MEEVLSPSRRRLCELVAAGEVRHHWPEQALKVGLEALLAWRQQGGRGRRGEEDKHRLYWYQGESWPVGRSVAAEQMGGEGVKAKGHVERP